MRNGFLLTFFLQLLLIGFFVGNFLFPLFVFRFSRRRDRNSRWSDSALLKPSCYRRFFTSSNHIRTARTSGEFIIWINVTLKSNVASLRREPFASSFGTVIARVKSFLARGDFRHKQAPREIHRCITYRDF